MKNLKLRDVIFLKGISQKKLSEKTNGVVRPEEISQHIHGKYNLDRRKREVLSDILEMPERELFEGTAIVE